jgi:hypothetical protein
VNPRRKVGVFCWRSRVFFPKRARLRAAELNTSLSALVKGFLEDLAGDDSEAQRHRRLPNELLQRLDALHQRDSSSQWGSGRSAMAPGCFLDTNVFCSMR